MNGYLIAEEGPLAGSVIAFEETEKKPREWVLGRDPDVSDRTLEDPMVSRRHVIIRETPEGFILENLSSVNPAMQNGKIIYTREQVFGGKQLTQDVQNRYGLSYDEAGRAKKDRTLPDDFETEVLMPFLEAVVQQAARSLQFFFSSSQFNEIDHILLAGGNANIPGLAKLLQQKLGYRVTIANPFLQMGFSPQIDLKKIENDAPSLMVACGLALRSFD
ncbi:MAG: type IV pilus assembly protein PilM [Pseudomonadota bacterium]